MNIFDDCGDLVTGEAFVRFVYRGFHVINRASGTTYFYNAEMHPGEESPDFKSMEAAIEAINVLTEK